MLKLRYYMALALVIFIAVVLINLPASTLLPALPSQEGLPETLKLGEPEGTVWQGRINLDYQDVLVTVNWDLKPWQIFMGRLAVDVVLLELNGSGTQSSPGRVQGSCFASVLTSLGCKDVKGFLPDTLINRLARKQLTLEQDITVQDLVVAFQDQRFTRAEGDINWPGGRVTYQAPGRGSQQVVLPALKAIVEEQEGRLQVSLMPQGTGDVLLDARVDGEGMAYLAVRKRLLDVLGQSWGKPVSPDFVVFEVQQALF